MKWVIVSLVAVACVATALWLYAVNLPATVVAKRETVIPAPVDRVFGLVTDVGNQHRWRRDVGQVSLAADGSEWTEHLKRGGSIKFRLVRKSPDSHFEIAYESSIGFSGRWVGTFAALDANSTSIRIEETTTTPGPVGRLLARLFSPPGSHTDLYLEDLKQAVRQM